MLYVPRAVDEELDRLGVFGPFARFRKPERQELVELFTVEPESLARGDEDVCPRRRHEPRAHSGSCAGDELFEIVEHEEELSARRDRIAELLHGVGLGAAGRHGYIEGLA